MRGQRQQELATRPHRLHRAPSQSHHPGRKRRLALCESVLRRGPAHDHAPAMGPARAQKATHRRHRRNLTCHLRCQASAPPRAMWSVAFCRLPLRQAYFQGGVGECLSVCLRHLCVLDLCAQKSGNLVTTRVLPSTKKTPPPGPRQIIIPKVQRYRDQMLVD